MSDLPKDPYALQAEITAQQSAIRAPKKATPPAAADVSAVWLVLRTVCNVCRLTAELCLARDLRNVLLTLSAAFGSLCLARLALQY
jgi:hypothetical protein